MHQANSKDSDLQSACICISFFIVNFFSLYVFIYCKLFWARNKRLLLLLLFHNSQWCYILGNRCQENEVRRLKTKDLKNEDTLKKHEKLSKNSKRLTYLQISKMVETWPGCLLATGFPINKRKTNKTPSCMLSASTKKKNLKNDFAFYKIKFDQISGGVKFVYQQFTFVVALAKLFLKPFKLDHGFSDE